MAEPNLSPAPTGTSSIYIASAEADTGKSAIALGLLHLLAASAARVGVFRPIVRSTDKADDLLELMLEHATATLDDYGQCLGVTYEQVHEDPEAALSEIVAKYHEVAHQCDAVLVIGSDYTDIINPIALSVNARIAANLGAPVVLAINGHSRSPQAISQIAQRCLTEITAVHARTAAIIANRCDPEQLGDVHGGKLFHEPTLITDATLAEIERLSDLAPLHNPANAIGIKIARKDFPGIPHVAVFDTGFFHTLPDAAATYAIHRDTAENYGIRRYGFHGTSHEYVAGRGSDGPGQRSEPAEYDRVAPRQRGVGLGGARRGGGRDLDGADPAGRPGDGHPLRRHRPRHPDAPSSHRGDHR